MTSAAVTARRHSAPRTARRVDPLLAALLVAVLAGVGALWALSSGTAAPPAEATARIALVVDAGAHPDAALAQARAAAERTERAGAASVEVRVPRSATEAATDVRYFAARGFDTVVAVGPVAGAAAWSRDVRRAGGVRVVMAPDLPHVVR